MVKHSKSIIILILTITAIGLLDIKHSSALTYQNSTDVSFTFVPTVAIDISGDLVISELAPGSASDSNEITISTSTNNPGGYTLYATVGSSSNVSTNLTHTNGSNTFSSISTTTDLTDFSDNEWGYSYCIAANDCTSSTYWVSGDYNGSATGYNGLPLYTTTGIKLADTSNLTDTSTIKFKIGAKASSSQIAGNYTNIINFAAITKILTTNYTISYNDTSVESANLPSGQTGTITQNTNVALSSTEPTRTNYTFQGWCTVDNTSDPATCAGTTYQAGDTYTIVNTGGTIIVPLYAVWESVAPTTYTVSFGNGRFSGDSTGAGEYQEGDTVTITFWAADLYKDGTSVNYTVDYSTCKMTYVFSMPAEDVIFTASNATPEPCLKKK